MELENRPVGDVETVHGLSLNPPFPTVAARRVVNKDPSAAQSAFDPVGGCNPERFVGEKRALEQ